MELYAGIDVLLNACALCVVDEKGGIVKEASLASEPEAVVDFFGCMEGAARNARVYLS